MIVVDAYQSVSQCYSKHNIERKKKKKLPALFQRHFELFQSHLQFQLYIETEVCYVVPIFRKTLSARYIVLQASKFSIPSMGAAQTASFPPSWNMMSLYCVRTKEYCHLHG